MNSSRFATPSAVVVGPDEGMSLWQPLPSRGYATVKLMPENMPYDDFSAGIQVLPPGCHVRQHAHQQNHELIFIYEGTGTVTIDSVTTPLTVGSTVLFGRYAQHRIDNTGTTDMKMFWVFTPPGLEGEAMPPAFDRPENVREVQDRMRFVPPPIDR
jgi:mannose-6-phosphate isomerase-like protein (cupin superfamily)